VTWRTDWAGVDEVGRGALAGPVVGAAVAWRAGALPQLATTVRDSKRLTPKRRRTLACALLADPAVEVALAWAEPAEIDRINILQASLRVLAHAFSKLDRPGVYVDGKHPLPDVSPQETVVGGDRRVPQIAAASIIAKVFRDQWMISLHDLFPAYGWAKNKGYGSADHLDALTQKGPSRHHRQSFAPVRQQRLFAL